MCKKRSLQLTRLPKENLNGFHVHTAEEEPSHMMVSPPQETKQLNLEQLLYTREWRGLGGILKTFTFSIGNICQYHMSIVTFLFARPLKPEFQCRREAGNHCAMCEKRSLQMTRLPSRMLNRFHINTAEQELSNMIISPPQEIKQLNLEHYYTQEKWREFERNTTCEISLSSMGNICLSTTYPS